MALGCIVVEWGDRWLASGSYVCVEWSFGRCWMGELKEEDSFTVVLWSELMAQYRSLYSVDAITVWILIKLSAY